METFQGIVLIVSVLSLLVAALSGLMWLRQWSELYVLRRRFEDIYIVGRTPEGYEPDFGPLNDLIDFVDYPDVYATTEHYRQALIDSQNKLGVTVYAWRYQYGAHVNENLEQYTERVLLDIQSSRAARHQYEAEQDPTWYEKYQRGENYIPYEW